MIILNKKALCYLDYDMPVFDNEEEKKLYLLTKYNTMINKSFPCDIEKAAEKSKSNFFINHISLIVHKEIYGSPMSKPTEIKKKNFNKTKEKRKVQFNEEISMRLF